MRKIGIFPGRWRFVKRKRIPSVEEVTTQESVIHPILTMVKLDRKRGNLFSTILELSFSDIVVE
jgi:hypothetical protein